MKNVSKISFANQKKVFVLRDKEKLRKWIVGCLNEHLMQPGHISFVFCDDNYLHKLNKQHLNHNTLTDIITFDYCMENIVSGEVYISVDRVKENAMAFSESFKDELHRVMIHGILHLCGYNDKSAIKKKQMTAKEDYYLSLRGF